MFSQKEINKINRKIKTENIGNYNQQKNKEAILFIGHYYDEIYKMLNITVNN